MMDDSSCVVINYRLSLIVNFGLCINLITKYIGSALERITCQTEENIESIKRIKYCEYLSRVFDFNIKWKQNIEM